MSMGIWEILWKMTLMLYLFGVAIVLVVGISGLSGHITIKGIFSTLKLSIFSWAALLYLFFSGNNYKNF